jgi:tetratricopeptide (TPR) repeat protein
MNMRTMILGASVIMFALATVLFGATATSAQGNYGGQQPAPTLNQGGQNSNQSQSQGQTQDQSKGQTQGQGQGQGQAGPNGQGRGRGPTIDPAEEADIKAFNAATDPDAKIKAAEDFEAKYPNSRYLEGVQGTLVTLYYDKQDWTKFYGEADKALVKDPDNVPVLTLVGWVIPRVYKADDPTEPGKLEQSEKDEKHALDLISTMQKPPALTDDQFNQAKASAAAQAHSGLGMTYFRRNDFQGSAKELETATTESPDVDPTDLFILGVDYQKLGQNSDAATAFNKCGQMPGQLQDQCKQRATAVQGATPGGR